MFLVAVYDSQLVGIGELSYDFDVGVGDNETLGIALKYVY